MSELCKRRATLAALCAWLVAVSLGFSSLDRYAGRPGAPSNTLIDWPAGTPIQPATNGITLVIALHPNCPCSRATLAELARIMSSGNRPLSAFVLMTEPQPRDPDCESTGLAVQAAALPGAKVIHDDNGALTARFGARTSGQVYAFDNLGHCLFSGGVTAARGHEGDCAGSDALRPVLRGEQIHKSNTPVFGCALVTPEARAAAKD